MRLDGSCHCGAVEFSVETRHPYPFNLCYCRTCRKTAGAGGYVINLSGDAQSLEVSGEASIGVYRPGNVDPDTGAVSPQERRFCVACGSALWIQDPRWPGLVHPYASAVDTELPTPPDRNHLMLGSKAGWVPVHADPQDHHFEQYPDQSIAEWHASRGLEAD